MNSPLTTVGIDISKQRLDLARFPQGDNFAVAYTDTGLAKMLKRLHSWSPQSFSWRPAAATSTAWWPPWWPPASRRC